MPADPNPTGKFETLRNVLASASRLATNLSANPLAGRLLNVLDRMPEEDRETLVMVLEREVDLRLMSRDGHGPLSGHRVTRANPNARLYLRVNEADAPPHIAPEEIVQAVIRASRVMHRSFQRGSQSQMRTVWGPAIVRGLRDLAADERESLRWFHQTILDFVDEAERPAECTGGPPGGAIPHG